MANCSTFIFASLVVSLLALPGCGRVASDEKPATPSHTNVKPARKTHTVGEVGADGRLAIWVTKRGSFDVPFPLDDDYGVMLVNEGGAKQPKALYVLGSREEKKVWQSQDLKEFQRLVNSIPKEAKVRVYDSCTVSLGHGLPVGIKDQFDKALQRFKLKDEDQNITCVCESLG